VVVDVEGVELLTAGTHGLGWIMLLLLLPALLCWKDHADTALHM